MLAKLSLHAHRNQPTNEQTAKNGNAPLIAPVHAMKKYTNKSEFSKRWGTTAFLIRLHYDGLKLTNSIEDNKPLKNISIQLGHNDLMIYNNLGKRFLRHHYRNKLLTSEYDHKPTKADVWSTKARFALNDFSSSAPSLTIAKKYPLRWSSGGAIPLVTRTDPWTGTDETWVALFFRNIDPIGWNIANGASDVLEEQYDLYKLINREFCEELLIYNAEPAQEAENTVRLMHFTDSHGRSKEFREASKRHAKTHMELRRKHDGLKELDYDSDAMTEIGTGLPTPWKFIIIDEDKNRHPVNNVVPCVNPHEFGIELVIFARFGITDREILLDGETDETNDHLTRSPIGLIRFSWLYDHLTAINADSEQKGERADPHGRLKLPIDNDDIQKNILVFRYDLDKRIERMDQLKEDLNQRKFLRSSGNDGAKNRELSRLQEWDTEFSKTFVDLVYDKTADRRSLKNFKTIAARETNSHGWYLCPVTWKTLRMAIMHDLVNRNGTPGKGPRNADPH